MHTFYLFIIIILVATASGCSTILRADFESDAVGSSPNSDLQGLPSGDRLYLPFRSGSIFLVESTGSGTEAHHELRIENRADLSVPGWPTRIDDGMRATKFISRPVSFPERPIATTVRANIKTNSGRFDMYFGDDENCAAMRLRFENDMIYLLSADSEPVTTLGELLSGFDFSITVIVNREKNSSTLFTAGKAPNIREEFTLPACVAESLWTTNVFAVGFVSPAERGSIIRIDVVEMSENHRGE